MFRVIVLCVLVAVAAGAAPKVRPIVPMLDGRIVGGEVTTIKEYPYQLSLEYYNRHFCGGSILSATRALTAAHCTDGDSPEELSVRAGSTRKQTGGQVSKVLQIAQHPRYNKRTFDNDVCVLILETPLEFGFGVQPIPLQQIGDEIAVGNYCTVSGWGTTSSGGTSSSLLRKVDVPRVSNADCQTAYNDMTITEAMTCYGLDNGGKDSCQGDSGGPLIGNGVQVGVVSWGYGCAHPDYPGVYAKVSHDVIFNFIAENL